MMFYSCCAEWDTLNLVAASGYDGIVLRGAYLANCPETALPKMRQALSESGLSIQSVNAFCPPEIKRVGEGFAPETLRRYTRRLASHAAALGVQYFGIGSPNSRLLSADYDRRIAADQWEQSIAIIAEIAGEYGITPLLEPLCTRECQWIHLLDEAMATLQHLQLSNVGLVLDLYHACVMGESPDALRRALPYVKVVHIAQNYLGQKYYLQPELTAVFTPYTEILQKSGYAGEFSVEATIGHPEQDYLRTLQIMKQLLPDRAAT